MKSRAALLVVGLFVISPAFGVEAQDDILKAMGIAARPPMIAAADETPVATNTDVAIQSLLDNCYSKFQNSSSTGQVLRPAHVTQSAAFGYILRADFNEPDVPKGMVDRLMCWKGGFQTQKKLVASPLDASK
ncbi:MAG: hypothetical protein WBQ17_07085 [Rhizomicrobium sp.]